MAEVVFSSVQRHRMAAKAVDIALLRHPGLTPLGKPVEIRYLRGERSQAAGGKQLYAV